MEGEVTVINSDDRLEAYIKRLREDYAKHKYLRSQHKTGRQRSPKQNNALHKYCSMLGDALNDAGWDQRAVLKPAVEIPWTTHAVKDKLWRPIQKAMYGDDSTTEPDRDEYPNIYETLNRHMTGKFGVFVPWPSKETMERAA
jgi:hypothetical protein